MKILYLDDNEINRFIVEKNLEKIHEIDCVEKASEAFELFENNEYDVFLIDLNLNDPSIDGFGVLHIIKSKYDQHKTKFIAHTNYIEESWKERCFNEGFDYYIPKPFNLQYFNSLFE